MPTVQHSQKELFLKIVYYGTGLSGKTSNLKYLHAVTKPEYRGKLISLDTQEDRTLFFDLMPIELGSFRGYSVRLHVCTVPGQLALDRTRRMILRGVDGVVMVVDSQRAALLANQRSMVNLDANLRWQGIEPERVPLVVQYNKRDLQDVLSVSQLQRTLNIPRTVPEVEAAATVGFGVSRTLKEIVKGVLGLIGDPRTLREGRTPSILPGIRPSLYAGAVPPVLGLRTDSSRQSFVFPRPANVPFFSEDPSYQEPDALASEAEDPGALTA